MEEWIDKANILIEALPYIREFNDKIFVIKYGGHAMIDEGLKNSFAQDIVLMKYVGFHPVVVHGGGPQIGEMLEKVGKTTEFVQGMRVTDEETIDIVEMVLAGKLNKEIVALINKTGGRAVGLSGKDGGLIKAKKLILSDSINDQEKPPEIIDLGLVGEVEYINTDIIYALIRNQFIPVVAPVGVGKNGETYNINADLVAGKLSGALKAEKLILLTDVEGVKDDKGNLISQMDIEQAKDYIQMGIIKGGMIPKLICCLDALKDGVKKSHIIDGRIKHAVLLEMFTKQGIGTEVYRGEI
ncbi:MAG: acetylglutamate kinase [Deltaproteobacteria bacterium]|nr:MAG: acetylglutamate kinase [Deltaproteobacteria bacterium]